jgi:ferric-dicitrate binding protein FerR (iron transport regulator)
MNDELLASYLLNEGDAAARRRVEDWIIESSLNRKYFEHFKTIWEASQQLVISKEVNVDAAWMRFKQRTFDKNKTQVIRRSFNTFRIAATVIVTFGLAALAYFIWERTNISTVTVASQNETVDKTLPDGSEITLNKHSTITYAGNFSGDIRKVTLKGEAFFNVTPNKSKLFVIDVNDITVTVVGTSFNIKEKDGSTEVTVATGKVKVERNDHSVLLNPNEKLTIAAKDSVLQPEKTKDKLYNYYSTHEFVCDDTPLWKLVEVLNEAYDAQIVIANPDIRNLPLTTTFHNETLENTITIISETFNITVERQGEKFILR